jgi:hypothetical protein
MRPVLPAALMVLTVAGLPVLAAQEDQDLNLIPQAAQQSRPAAVTTAAGTGAQRSYLENALSFTPLRDSLLVPFPPPTPASWDERLFLDTRHEWRLGDGVLFDYSGRLNLRAANDLPFPSHENVLNELREAFVSWQPSESVWLDVGRINIKSGVAVGYNPTDYFRTRSVVLPLTADPTILREDRLGTLMVQGQFFWSGGSITTAFAPRVTLPTALYRTNNLPNFDPMLDRTNAEDRFLLMGSARVAEGFSPELLIYHAGNRTQFGANLTTAIGQQTVAYAEWAGGANTSLIDNALSYGRQTGTLPATALAVIPADRTLRFENDTAAGFSFATQARITVNLEYHYYQPGFSQQDWRNWFGVGSRQGTSSTLWYIRSYALDQQVPVSRHSAFVRVDWVDAFVPNLELTALANVSLLDGSSLVQTTADYHLSDVWTVGGLASFTYGGRRSEFGSLPQVGSVLLRLARYI